LIWVVEKIKNPHIMYAQAYLGKSDGINQASKR
jgi:hypothetical protein